MNAVDRWKSFQDQSALFRQVRWDGEESIWRTSAKTYDRTAYGEGQQTIIAGRVAARLVGARSAIEIGAGPGTLTLTLASHLERLIVVEPSPAMRAVLEERLSSVGAGHVLILPHRWEETEIEPVDVVVAGGCLYVFYDIDQALLKMVASGRHKVIITHLANDGLWDFEKRVCERLLLDSPSLFPPFALLADVFLHLKLAATIDLFYLPESRRLSLEQWAERCQRRLKVPEARRSALLKAIANELHATGDYYVAEQSFPFVLIQIQSE